MSVTLAPFKGYFYLFSFVICCLLPQFGSAQFKHYFDKVGKASSSETAYYYRQNIEADKYKSFYVNGGSTYFEGRIINASTENEGDNVYAGECTWYHKNGNIRLKRTFDEAGLEQGNTTYYHESGKKWKEVQFKDGVQVRGNLIEYDEDGTKSEYLRKNLKTILMTGICTTLVRALQTWITANFGFSLKPMPEPAGIFRLQKTATNTSWKLR